MPFPEWNTNPIVMLRQPRLWLLSLWRRKSRPSWQDHQGVLTQKDLVALPPICYESTHQTCDRFFPTLVFGPVDNCALWRFASRCFVER